MRLVSMAVRDELVVAIAERYGGSLRWEKARILDEFVAVSGYHRKHAMRLLREGRTGKRSDPRPARRVYDEAVREALASYGPGPRRRSTRCKRHGRTVALTMSSGVDLGPGESLATCAGEHRLRGSAS